MSKNQVEEQIKFLQKFAEFTKLVLQENQNLREKNAYHMSKQASEELDKEKYQETVIKVANALYNSDLDFVTGDFDRRKFIKRAMEDPSYLARTLEKVCEAADVSLIGKPARVAANTKVANYDPVYMQAFGHQHNEGSIIDLD